MLCLSWSMISFTNFILLQLSQNTSWTSKYACTLWFPHVSYITHCENILAQTKLGIRVIPVWWKSGLARQAAHENQNWIQQHSFNLAYKSALEDRSPKISSFTDCNFWYMYVFHDYLGLSRHYFTSTNFLSKHDTSKFMKVGTVSHTSGITSN